MHNKQVKDRIRNALHRIGLIKGALPAAIINNIEIKENHDPLVDIKEDADFFFGSDLQKEKHVYLRKSVYEKLKDIQLPEGSHIKIISAYRSLEEQTRRWNAKCKEMRIKYPNIAEDELIAKVKQLCADPRAGFGGHQTGGAIDITICDSKGNDYDMGTAYSSSSPQSRTDTPYITEEQAKNRTILVEALKSLDFVNYPLEWWHHSYGDRLWAAYKHHRQCLYGMPSENEFMNIKKNEINNISISFSVPPNAKNGCASYDKELVMDELQGADTRSLAKIACDMAWNDTITLLLKSDEGKLEYEQFIKTRAPDLLPRWNEIMQHRPAVIKCAESILNKPFAEMTSKDIGNLYNKIDKKTIPLEHWHINFSQLTPDLKNRYDTPEGAFIASAQQYIEGAATRRKGNEDGVREGFWLAIRDKESNNLIGVMAISTRIIQNNLIGHSARFISPDYQRRRIAATAGSVALDFMYKYLADVEKPDLYKNNEPVFATTCHPFNSASRGLQGHNGARFSGYDPKAHKFRYATSRAAHEEMLNSPGNSEIAWTATYKGNIISSQTGSRFQLSVKKEVMPMWQYKSRLTKDAR